MGLAKAMRRLGAPALEPSVRIGEVELEWHGRRLRRNLRPAALGHLILAEAALEQLKLDKVMFVPAGDPWRKAGRKVTPALTSP